MSWLASLLISGLMMTSFGDGIVGVAGDPPHAAVVQSSTDDPHWVGQETERFDQTYPFSSGGRVTLENLNGSVVIETWDRNEIRVEYTKSGTDKEVMSWVDVRVNATRERINIEANYDGWKANTRADWEKMRGRKVNVAFKLTVPRTAALNGIETVNGSVTVADINGICKISTVNGNVTGKNLRGTVSLSTVNGTVDADFEQLDNTSRVSLETVNGRVMATIPSDSDATVKADTMNGEVTNDFGLPVKKGQYVGKDFHGRLASGSARVTLTSVNGRLHLARKQDGRSLSPVTNLLTTRKDKNGVDVDVDVDIDALEVQAAVDASARAASAANVGKEIERAIREAAVAVPVVIVDEAINEGMRAAARAQKDAIRDQANKNRALNEQLRNMAREQQRLDMINQSAAGSVLPTAERQEETIPVKGTPKIIVDAKNCAVSIKSWDKPEVQYSLTKVSRSTAQSAVVDVFKEESKIRFRVSNNTAANRYWLQIYVPKKTNLKIATDKEIRLDGISGEIELNAISDEINVRDSEGKLIAVSVDGKMRIVGFQGEVDCETTEGLVSLEGNFTRLNANVGDGTLVLTVPENYGAYISTTKESIFGEGLALTKQDDKWKIGNGGETLRIQSRPDGKIIVRNSSMLRAAN